MSSILLSIKPKYIDEIFKGNKRFEFRTKIPKSSINHIYIYATFPVKKVVGEVDVTGVIKDRPNNIWNITSAYSGVSKKEFDDYFKNRTTGYAYILGKVRIYDKQIELENLNIKRAPQNFAYIDK